MDFVIKRNGDSVPFEDIKITNAIFSVMKELDKEADDDDWSQAVSWTDDVVTLLETNLEGEDITPSVAMIDDCVEEVLMEKYHKLAKAYILHRDKKDQANRPDLFRKRTEYKPFEYPHLHAYVDAIRNSYWVHTEFNFKSDVQDFLVKMSPKERESVRRCILAIAQIEVGVKTFWGKIGDKIPKPEIAEVGATFAESEVRHANGYSFLLEILGLNSDFKKVTEVPAIKKRIAYMEKVLKNKDAGIKEYVQSVLSFALFIENVSLFSQFLIINSFNERKNLLKGTSNLIAATALEENVHASFGADLINDIRKENPEWFDAEMDKTIMEMVFESFEAESEIIDWIFGEGEVDVISKSDVIEYIKNRYNLGLKQAGFNEVFTINEATIAKYEWFEVQIKASGHTDFFSNRSVNYSKFTESFDADDMF